MKKQTKGYPGPLSIKHTRGCQTLLCWLPRRDDNIKPIALIVESQYQCCCKLCRTLIFCQVTPSLTDTTTAFMTSTKYHKSQLTWIAISTLIVADCDKGSEPDLVKIYSTHFRYLRSNKKHRLWSENASVWWPWLHPKRGIVSYGLGIFNKLTMFDIYWLITPMTKTKLYSMWSCEKKEKKRRYSCHRYSKLSCGASPQKWS